MAGSTEVFNMTESASDLLTSTMATVAAVLNESVARNATGAGHSAGPAVSARFMLLVKVVYAIGIVGNACAIVALRRGERRVRNRKHLLLLTSLAANDLVALVSNTALLFFNLQRHKTQNLCKVYFCYE